MDVVALYCRVSTEEQAKEGYSLGEQESRLRKFAESKGWTVAGVYKDAGFSGAKLDRPAIQSLIRDVKNHLITKVCVFKLDRLSRSQKDTLYLIEDIFIKNHVDFISMNETLDTSTPFGMAMIGIMACFAQLERETIKERMSIGRDARIADGYYKGSGNIPIGYRYINGNLVIDEYEAQKVRELFEGITSGVSLSAIARSFTESHVRDKCWTTSHLKRILQNSIYICKQRWKGATIDLRQDCRIVSDDLYYAAQSELGRRSQAQDKPQTQHQHTTLLGGMLWCGICGGRYAGLSDKSKGKTIHRYYCYTRINHNHKRTDATCDNKSWRSDQLDTIVLNEIRKVSIDRSIIESTPTKDDTLVRMSSLSARIKDIDEQMDKIVELYAIGSIPTATIVKKTTALERERTTLEEELQKIKVPPKADRISLSKALDDFDAIIDHASGDKMELYTIVRQLIRSVKVTGDTVEINWNI